MNFGNGGDIRQNLLADLINDLLDAARFKTRKNALDDLPNTWRHRGAAAGDSRVGKRPVEIKPHVQRTVVNIRQRGVFIADETGKRAALEAKQPEAGNSRF